MSRETTRRIEAADCVQKLLARIRRTFYANNEDLKRFYQDRQMLIYTLTWPAQWLDERALAMRPERYEQLITQRLDAIVAHGEPSRYNAYFPRYLLKCLQDWFAHHGENLYDELKHVRNALFNIEHLLRQSSHTQAQDVSGEHTSALAQTHRILHTRKRNRSLTSQNQLELF